MRLLATLVLILAAGRSAPAEEVAVFAAAALTDCLREVATDFEEATGNTVVLNVAASSDLARQIRAGGPADVFFSADAAQMDLLEKAGLVRAAERVDVLSTTLVVVVPADGATTIRTSDDLLRVRRLALANPEAAPAGVYARAWLESVGLWTKLEEKVVPTLNVRAALSAVESGHVDAGIVFRTDAARSKRVRVALEVPRQEGPAIVFVLAPVARSGRPVAAAALARHLTSAAAHVVYARHGFVVLPR